MPVVQPNTADMEDLSPTEPGTYPAQIVSCGSQRAKESGTQMIVPKFELDVSGKTKTRTAYLCIEGKGTYGFDQLLRAIGLADLADKYAQGQGEPFDTDILVEQKLMVVVDQEKYNDEFRDRIKTFLPA